MFIMIWLDEMGTFKELGMSLVIKAYFFIDGVQMSVVSKSQTSKFTLSLVIVFFCTLC